MDKEECIKANIDGNEYLIPVRRVKTVIPDPVVVEVPGALKEIEGITEYEGKIVPWLRGDGGSILTGRRCGIIIEVEKGHLAGILADDDIEVQSADPQEIESELTQQYMRLLKGSVT